MQTKISNDKDLLDGYKAQRQRAESEGKARDAAINAEYEAARNKYEAEIAQSAGELKKTLANIAAQENVAKKRINTNEFEEKQLTSDALTIFNEKTRLQELKVALRGELQLPLEDRYLGANGDGVISQS